MAAAGVILWRHERPVGSPRRLLEDRHGGGDGSNVEPFTESASSDDLTLTYWMNPAPKSVRSTPYWKATDSSGALVPNTTLK
jgi:hypothetical protein